MTDTKALDALIEAVERGNDEMAVLENATFMGGRYAYVLDAYRGDLSAAKALHEALLPGWGWETGVNATFVSIASVWKSWRERAHSATADDPARSWLLAVLKAWRAVLLGGAA